MDFVAIQKMAFSLIGGLGIFLLGMKYMSEGLQTIAGQSLKKLIAAVTGNRFFATGIGVLVTMIVQSSSVTTVMAVGFVNSGIMALGQAIGVILGANIGTTITGWIIALKVGKWGLPILGIAAFFFLFSKKEKWKYTALAILGVGMVFFGLEVMKGGVKVIKSIPEFEEAFTYFTADSYFGVLKCALAGCILTVLVQSSSATLGITIALASQGVIEFETAAALVLGENIGTTITALLASIGTTTNAKRAAYFHMTFNLIGVVWITALFQVYMPFIEWVNSAFFGVSNIKELVMKGGSPTFPNTEFAIASVHTIFNVVNVIMFIPLTKIMADFLVKVVPDKKIKSDYLTALDFDEFDSTMAALEYSNSEIKKMQRESLKLLNSMTAIYVGESSKNDILKSIKNVEENFDEVQMEVSNYLARVFALPLSEFEVYFSNQQFRLVDEFESLSDFAYRITALFGRLEDHGKTLHHSQITALTSIHGSIVELLKSAGKEHMVLSEIKEKSHKIDEELSILKSKHWKKASEIQIDPMLATSYSDILALYRSMKDHVLHVGEASVKFTEEA